MIPGHIDDIDVDPLQALIAKGVREGKTIEYERAVPGGADGDLVPFLAPISSLANTAEGDLLLGVEANNSMPAGSRGDN